MEPPIISVSGLRGIIGQSLTPGNAIQYVAAFSSQLPDGPVVVTRDGRSSGPMLGKAICAAFSALGRDVCYGDVAATPTTGVLVRQRQAAGGVQISASHNPPEYNGIKLFASDGRVISSGFGQRIIEAMSSEPAWVRFDKLGHSTNIEDTVSEHLRLVLATVDVAAIRKAGLSAVLDSNHGAGGLLGRHLMEALGVQTVFVGEEPNGAFAHTPEPTRENLEPVSLIAKSHGVDVVFCQDPDADRLAIIAADGSYIGEEYTLALTLRNRLAKKRGACVINCATSRMSIDISEQFGCRCHISAVGEANVCDMMNQVNAVYGGEGNGGPIDPEVGYVRDSFVAMAQVLELMATSGKTVLELIAEIPRYAIVKSRASIDRDQLPRVFENLKARFPEAEVSELDGLRFDWPDKWLLVRPSNTEPIVRVICEAGDELSASQLSAVARSTVEQ
jgi:phosphomannomutase